MMRDSENTEAGVKVVKYSSEYSLSQIVDLYNAALLKEPATKESIKSIIKHRPIFYLLVNDDDVVGFVNGMIITTKTDPYIARYISSKKTLIISDIVSTVSGGGRMLINKMLEYDLDIFLTAANADLINFYTKFGFSRQEVSDPDDQRIVMTYIKKNNK